MKESRYNVWVERRGRHYVYNGVSGAIVGLEQREKAALSLLTGGTTTAAGEIGQELLERLVRARALIADGIDELEVMRKRYARIQANPGHLGLTLVTSLGCNFNCPYCFEDKHPSVMDADVQRALLQLLDDRAPYLSTMSVSWFGGEPLLGKDALAALSDEFIEQCEASAIEYSADITTNGWYLTPDVVDMLVERRVRNAQVTLDGTPDVHDERRPHVNGRGTFDRILDNIVAAAGRLAINVRVNLDHGNLGSFEGLLEILGSRGLAGKIGLSPGHLVAYPGSPEESLPSLRRRFSTPEFAQAQLEFSELARRHGFGRAGLPGPSCGHCTAIRSGEVVVGSKGELYKCWADVGNEAEVIGDIRNYQNTNSRLHKWLSYDPLDNAECRSCIALPVCFGGCASHAFSSTRHEDRCGTFRFAHREQVERYIDAAQGIDIETDFPLTQASRAAVTGAAQTPVAVAISARPVHRTPDVHLVRSASS